MASYLEIRANCILKRVLKDSIDHGIEIPDDVPLWVARYPQVCDDGTSERSQNAVADAKNVMEKLYRAIIDHPIHELQCMVHGWRQEVGDPRNQQKTCARAPAALSEANVKRGRSQSPRRTNGDPGLIRIINEHAVELAAKDAEIARLKREIASMTEIWIECGNFASGDYGVICENSHFRS
jgi:hypothetical protein